MKYDCSISHDREHNEVSKIPVLTLVTLLLTFFFLIVGPSLPVIFGFQSSNSTGTLLAGVFITIASLSIKSGLNHLRKLIDWAPVVFWGICIHLIVTAILFENVAMYRALLSLVPLFFLVLASSNLRMFIYRLSSHNVIWLINNAIRTMLIVGGMGCLSIFQPFRDTYPKSIFPFNEASHFALILTPVLISACAVSKRRYQIFYICLSVLEAVILQNLTMVIGCLMTVLIFFKRRDFVIILLLFYIFESKLNIDYYIARLEFADTKNLSALVYLQGWQTIFESWKLTHLFGLGFQQLGIKPLEIEATFVIQNIIGDNSNLLDGGFTASKILSEFGIFAIGILFVYFRIASKALRLLWLSENKDISTHPLLLSSAAFIIAFVLELFVRGAGYFSPGAMLFLAALIIWNDNRRELNSILLPKRN